MTLNPGRKKSRFGKRKPSTEHLPRIARAEEERREAGRKLQEKWREAADAAAQIFHQSAISEHCTPGVSVYSPEALPERDWHISFYLSRKVSHHDQNAVPFAVLLDGMKELSRKMGGPLQTREPSRSSTGMIVVVEFRGKVQGFPVKVGLSTHV
jgi:hypothetical protein